MKKNFKTALYVGVAALVAYFGYNWYVNSKDDVEDSNTGGGTGSTGLGNSEPIENEDGLAVEPTDGAVEVSTGGSASVSQEIPIVFGQYETGMQVEVLEMANGVYQFTPIYDEEGTIAINDEFLDNCSWIIDGVNLGNYVAESSILAEFTHSGTYPFSCVFNFVENTQYEGGASMAITGAINVLLAGGVPIATLEDYVVEVDPEDVVGIV